MLAARSLRLAGVRCINPAFNVCSTNIRIPPVTLLQQTSVTSLWYTRPLTAAYYSKDIKPGVIFSFACFHLASCYHLPKINVTTSASPNTLSFSESPTPPLTEKTSKSTNPSDKPLTPTSSSATKTSSTPLTSSQSNEKDKTQNDKSCTGPIGDTGVKLPSKDQVESFVFKSLVYLWDFTYYVFCLCRKLIETYVFNNSTVQYYWKLLLKRMDDARKELKSK